jgi:hypothetical protein
MRRTVAIVALGLLLWSAWPVPRFWALLLAFFAAWQVFNLERALRRPLLPSIRGAGALALLVVLPLPALRALSEKGEDLLYGEGLHGVTANLRDRMRLEALPSIHPGVIFGDHPQRLYAYAPGARTFALDLGTARAPEVDDLGHGLFRVRFDPRVHGALPRRASVRAELVVDGERYERELASVSPAPHPRWLCVSPDRARAYAPSEETDELVMVHDAGLGFRAEVGDGPTSCAVVGDEVFVGHRYAAALVALDARTGRERRRLEGPGRVERLAASLDGAYLFVAVGGPSPGIEVRALPGGERVAFVPTPSTPEWLVPAADGGVVAAFRRERTVRRVARTDGRFELERNELPMERPVITMAGSADGALVYAAVSDFRDSLGEGPHPLGNHFVQDQLLLVDAASLKVVGRFVTGRRDARQDEPATITRGASPMGLDPQPDGTLFVAFAGTDEVWRVDPLRGLVALRFETAADRLPAPHGVARLASGRVVVASPVGGAIGVYADGELAARALLDDPRRADRSAVELRRHGERVFFEATRAGISCDSCHLHADTDHSPHNIGPRLPLYTLTVRGLAGTAPYLRDASHARLGDLVDVSDFMLHGFLRGDRRRRPALEAYLSSLPREPSPRDPPLETLRAGLDAFFEASCDRCHALPAFTNLGPHPIRALFPVYGRRAMPADSLDTPSLLGLHASAPYLQDGRAETLRQVLRAENRANLHGNTAALDEAEADALIAFLEAL